MIRAFLIAALTLTALFGLIVGGLRLQPRDDPAARLVGCAMPCWNGITPGTTSREDGVSQLSTLIGRGPFTDACSVPMADTCLVYTWQVPSDGIPYAEMVIERRQIQTLTFNTPDLMLGDVLLALDGLHIEMDGAYPGFETGNEFYAQFLFANTNLILRANAPCPGGYLALMQSPIRTVEVDAPRLTDSVDTITSFAVMRADFGRVCS